MILQTSDLCALYDSCPSFETDCTDCVSGRNGCSCFQNGQCIGVTVLDRLTLKIQVILPSLSFRSKWSLLKMSLPALTNVELNHLASGWRTWGWRDIGDNMQIFSQILKKDSITLILVHSWRPALKLMTAMRMMSLLLNTVQTALMKANCALNCVGCNKIFALKVHYTSWLVLGSVLLDSWMTWRSSTLGQVLNCAILEAKMHWTSLLCRELELHEATRLPIPCGRTCWRFHWWEGKDMWWLQWLWSCLWLLWILTGRWLMDTFRLLTLWGEKLPSECDRQCGISLCCCYALIFRKALSFPMAPGSFVGGWSSDAAHTTDIYYRGEMQKGPGMAAYKNITLRVQFTLKFVFKTQIN